MCIRPMKSAFASEISEWRKYVRTTRPHIAIKGSKFTHVRGRLQRKNGLDLFTPRFEDLGREPLAKPIGFSHSPLAYERGDREEAVGFELGEDKMQDPKMIIPRVGKDANIIDGDINFGNVA